MDDAVQIARIEARDDTLTRALDEVGVVVAVRRQAAAAACSQGDRPVIPDLLILCREEQDRLPVRREPADPPPGDTLRPGRIEASARGDFRLTAAPRVVLPYGGCHDRQEVTPGRGAEAVRFRPIYRRSPGIGPGEQRVGVYLTGEVAQGALDRLRAATAPAASAGVAIDRGDRIVDFKQRQKTGQLLARRTPAPAVLHAAREPLRRHRAGGVHQNLFGHAVLHDQLVQRESDQIDGLALPGAPGENLSRPHVLPRPNARPAGLPARDVGKQK